MVAANGCKVSAESVASSKIIYFLKSMFNLPIKDNWEQNDVRVHNRESLLLLLNIHISY